jgi:hypothetical protein
MDIYDPVVLYKLNYKTNKITPCDKKKFGWPRFEKDSFTFYYDIYCYDVSKKNKIASEMLHFPVYGHIIFESNYKTLLRHMS